MKRIQLVSTVHRRKAVAWDKLTLQGQEGTVPGEEGPSGAVVRVVTLLVEEVEKLTAGLLTALSGVPSVLHT